MCHHGKLNDCERGSYDHGHSRGKHLHEHLARESEQERVS
jgi:hypothetical protein